MLLKVLLLIVSAALIILSLLQSGKSDGLGALSGQQGLGLFANVKERGPEKVISNITMIVGITFFILVIIIRIVEKV